jgi:hypothetical protein
MDADVEEFRAGARQHRRGAGALGALLGGLAITVLRARFARLLPR